MQNTLHVDFFSLPGPEEPKENPRRLGSKCAQRGSSVAGRNSFSNRPEEHQCESPRDMRNAILDLSGKPILY